jgi:hypothetical protein
MQEFQVVNKSKILFIIINQLQHSTNFTLLTGRSGMIGNTLFGHNFFPQLKKSNFLVILNDFKFDGFSV